MTKYYDERQPRYRFYVRETMNGYALQILVVDRDENIPMSPAAASAAGIALPDSYRMQCCTRDEAEKELARVADLNGLTMIH